MHYYCGGAGDPLHFTEAEWNELIYKASRMEEIILRNWSIICAHGLQNEIKLIVDEWGCWHRDGSGPSRGYNLFEQQSTMRDAVVAALTLNIFNKHCDKVRMANVAQLVNNLHALFLAGGEHCIVTPTYHVFDMYKEHQGAEAIETVVTGNDELARSVSVSASVKDGKLLVTLANLSCAEDAEIALENVGMTMAEQGKLTVLSHEDMHAHNTFDAPEAIKPTEMPYRAGEAINVPRAGVVALEIGVEV
jgi:alpha-N-arabinofuranosidase